MIKTRKKREKDDCRLHFYSLQPHSPMCLCNCKRCSCFSFFFSSRSLFYTLEMTTFNWMQFNKFTFPLLLPVTIYRVLWFIKWHLSSSVKSRSSFSTSHYSTSSSLSLFFPASKHHPSSIATTLNAQWKIVFEYFTGAVTCTSGARKKKKRAKYAHEMTMRVKFVLVIHSAALIALLSLVLIRSSHLLLSSFFLSLFLSFFCLFASFSLFRPVCRVYILHSSILSSIQCNTINAHTVRHTERKWTRWIEQCAPLNSLLYIASHYSVNCSMEKKEKSQ